MNHDHLFSRSSPCARGKTGISLNIIMSGRNPATHPDIYDRFPEADSNGRTAANDWVRWLKDDVLQQPDYKRAQDATNKSEKITRAAVPTLSSQNQPIRKMVVRLTKNDTFTAAKELYALHQTDKIAVHNMANAHVVGGGFLQGAMAQEEDLCHCSTLYVTLDGRGFYPLDEDDLIYSPDVLVLKAKDPSCSYGRPMHKEEFFYTNVISCAAHSRPRLRRTQFVDGDGNTKNYGTYADHEDEQSMNHKLNMILNAALQKGVQRLVLSAFGCGSFQNPPVKVAMMMKETLLGNENGDGPQTNWATHGLLEVVIAIFDPPLRSGQVSNFDAFMSVFRQGSHVHTTGNIPVPDDLQYTVFPPNYAAAAQDDNMDQS